MTAFRVQPAPINDPMIGSQKPSIPWIRWFQELFRIPQKLGSTVADEGASLIGLEAVAGMSAADVQAAIEELNTDITAIDGRVDTLETAGLMPLFTQTADVTVANTTTETTLLGAGTGSLTIGANGFHVGDVFCVRVQGRISDTGTPGLNIKVKLGSTLAIATGNIPLQGTISDNYWELFAQIGIRTLGASGTAVADGRFTYDNGNQTGKTIGLVGASSITLDTTTDETLDVTATWDAADAANSITAVLVTLERWRIA